MKLLYVSYYDTDNVREWSGIPYHMLRAARHVFDEVELVSSPKVPFRLWNRAAFRICRDVLKTGYLREVQTSFLKDYARAIEKELLPRSGDIVFSDMHIVTGLLDCDRPVVTWSDATMGALRGHYYENYREFPLSRRASDRAQRRAVENAALSVYASEWARNSAIRDYGADPAKAIILPFGANMISPPSREMVEQAIQSRKLDMCRLLLIGVEWERKGADLAVKVAERLYQDGVKVELTIMGCWPKNPAELPSYVRLQGFVNKQDARERDLFEQTLVQSTFLLFPSRAEAFGIVACEAAAYGVPTLSSDVGGITNAVRSGENGLNFPLENYVEGAVSHIKEYLVSPREYASLALKSRDEYERELNWEAGFKKIRNFFEFPASQNNS